MCLSDFSVLDLLDHHSTVPAIECNSLIQSSYDRVLEVMLGFAFITKRLPFELYQCDR